MYGVEFYDRYMGNNATNFMFEATMAILQLKVRKLRCMLLVGQNKWDMLILNFHVNTFLVLEIMLSCKFGN